MSEGGDGDTLPPPGGTGGALVQPNAKNRSAATARMAANVASFISMPLQSVLCAPFTLAGVVVACATGVISLGTGGGESSLFCSVQSDATFTQ